MGDQLDSLRNIPDAKPQEYDLISENAVRQSLEDFSTENYDKYYEPAAGGVRENSREHSSSDYGNSVFYSLSYCYENKPEKNAIYVCPYAINYGYYLPIPNRVLNGNTYTFIYEKKRGYDLFLSPISKRKHFSKTFISYKKYSRKLKKYINSKKSYKDCTMRSIHATPHPEYDLTPENMVQQSLGFHNASISNGLSNLDEDVGISKLLQIFDIPSYDKSSYITPTQGWPIHEDSFKPPEPIKYSGFGKEEI